MKIRGAVLTQMGADRPYAESRPLQVRELELDPPQAGEVLIELKAAGVCHSDLSVVNGSRPRPLPMLLGHEGAGVVVEVGDGVEGLDVGDHVVAVFLPRCGECRHCLTDGRLPCIPGSESNNAGFLPGTGRQIRLHDLGAGEGAAARGSDAEGTGGEVLHHLGVSAFATYAVVNAASVVRVGKDVPWEVCAPLGCAVLTGGGAVINAGKPRDGDSVMVVGLGGVGVAALLTALSLGHGEVIGVDANPEKLELARNLGAVAYSPEEVASCGITADVVIEAAGHPRAFETAYGATGIGGTCVTVGLPHPDAESVIKPLSLTAGARTIIGSYLGSAVPQRDIPVFEQLWREGRLDVAQLVSSRIRLEEINEAMDLLADGQAVRQVIVFE